MNKMSFIHVLMTFYKKDTMLYVGKNWTGNGYLLLIALCAYCSIFISYNWNKEVSKTYENFYKPSLASVPPVKLEGGLFKFDAEMPVKIKHPVTGKEVIYIDTRSDEIPEEASKYRTIITEKQFIISDILLMFRGHSFTHNFILFPFAESPFKDDNYVDDLIPAGERIVKRSHFNVYCLTFLISVANEVLKTLLITFIVIIMFRNGAMKSKFNKNFSFISRLCILTYIPVLLTNSLYLFLMATPGIFMIIFTSFIHIILLMSAIHINIMDEEELTSTQ